MTDLNSSPCRVAIVGAGMAGMSCASYLQERGCVVSLFDKGRGPGGRMSTRRISHDGEEFHFDHGAQYFTAENAGFARQIRQWSECGVVAHWPDGPADAWVGTPSMNAPLKHMAANLDISFSRRIICMQRQAGTYSLRTEAGAIPQQFDSLVVAVPAEQATSLLAALDFDMARQAVGISSTPCWTLMCAFAEPLAGVSDSYKGAGPIAWAARNSAKPDRDAKECWVVQASADWSRQHLERDAESVAALLMQEFGRAMAIELPQPILRTAHRWRFAFPAASDAVHLWNADTRLGACGDWLAGASVQDAWLSGRALAREMLGQG